MSYFVDTNILIDFLKGNDKVINRLGFEHIYISDIVVMELYQGAKNKSDLAFIKKNLNDIKIVDTSEDIVFLAKNLVEKYTLSHNLKIFDAIIAATVIIYDLPLVTLNKKDFRYIQELELYEI